MTPGAVLFSPRYYAHNLDKLSQINAAYVFIPWTFTVTFLMFDDKDDCNFSLMHFLMKI